MQITYDEKAEAIYIYFSSPNKEVAGTAVHKKIGIELRKRAKITWSI